MDVGSAASWFSATFIHWRHVKLPRFSGKCVILFARIDSFTRFDRLQTESGKWVRAQLLSQSWVRVESCPISSGIHDSELLLALMYFSFLRLHMEDGSSGRSLWSRVISSKFCKYYRRYKPSGKDECTINQKFCTAILNESVNFSTLISNALAY